MSDITEADILFRAGGAELQRTGSPVQRRRWDAQGIEAPTVTRADAATCATFINADGVFQKAAANQLRVEWMGGAPGLLCEASRTNVLPVHSEAVTSGNGWSQACTATASFATCGAMALTRLSGVSLNVASATVVVATGINAVSFVTKFDSTGIAHHGLWDNTAGAWKALASVVWGASATCTIGASGGTVLAIVTLTSNTYRVLMQTTTCITTNANLLYASDTGGTTATSVCVGGFQVENFPWPSSYIATTTNTVTRAADSVSVPIGFMPQDLTVYLRVPRPPWADVGQQITSFPIAVAIGAFAAGSAASIYGGGIPPSWAALLGGTVAVAASETIPAGATLEVCVQFRYDTDRTCRIDVGSGFGTPSPATTNPTFRGQNIHIGASAALGTGFGGSIQRLLVVKGLHTLAECQAVYA